MAAGSPSVEELIAAGEANARLGRLDEAAYWYERALAADPNRAPALAGLARALNALGRPGEALAALEKLRKLRPNDAAAAFQAGDALEQLGRLAEARRAFENAAEFAPRSPMYLRAAMKFAPVRDGDACLVGLKDMARDEKSLSAVERVELHFALAKADDDCGRIDDAFAHLETGNALRRAMTSYNEAGETAVLRELAEVFSAETMQAKRGLGHASEVPVFVLGMPRSGTTLVEQVLASHPDVFGAGEVSYLHELAMCGMAGERFPAAVQTLSAEDWRRLGGYYAMRLGRHAPQARRIVDKMPMNFRLIGLIALALPKARIVHVRRDPLDTCFSCYTKLQ